MYKIDLLKGEGIPIRSRPGGVAFACLVIAVPLIVGITMVSIFVEHRVASAVQRQQLTRLRRVITALAPALEAKRALEERKALGMDLLGDVKTALGRRTQWSPILATVVATLPETLVLTKLQAHQSMVRRQVPSRDNPETLIDISVPVRALEIRVCGEDGHAASRAVRRFQDSLRSSATLGHWLDALTVSQESQTLDGQDVVSYELNCVFKPAIE
jgi:hypothetical protein